MTARPSRDDEVTWEGIAAEIERAGFGVGMLDPNGEMTPGLEALLLTMASDLREEIESSTEEKS